MNIIQNNQKWTLNQLNITKINNHWTLFKTIENHEEKRNKWRTSLEGQRVEIGDLDDPIVANGVADVGVVVPNSVEIEQSVVESARHHWHRQRHSVHTHKTPPGEKQHTQKKNV